jgi:hypothetical protein
MVATIIALANLAAVTPAVSSEDLCYLIVLFSLARFATFLHISTVQFMSNIPRPSREILVTQILARHMSA